jgi:hypothetical protein
MPLPIYLPLLFFSSLLDILHRSNRDQELTGTFSELPSQKQANILSPPVD